MNARTCCLIGPMRFLALLLAPGILAGQMQLAPGSLGSAYYSPSAGAAIPSAMVSLRPVGTSTPIPAQVVSVADGTLTFTVPLNAPPGQAELIYKVSGGTTQWTEVAIVPANFTISAAQIVAGDGTARPNMLTKPAQPGESVVLWGSGLGLAPASNVSVTFGGVAQKVLYAGTAPNLSGVNQINFQVGTGVPDGCYVPVSVSAGASTAVTYLSKSSNGAACPHPFHLSAGDLATLDAGGTIDVGQIETVSNVAAVTADHASRQEYASVSLGTWNAAQIATAVETNQAPTLNYSGLTVGAQMLSSIDVTEGAAFTSIDAPLAALPAPMLPVGPAVWSNSGSAQLAASSFAFTLPPPILISGTVPLEWSAGQPQTITWNPAGYDSGAVLQVRLVSANGVTGAAISGLLGAVVLVPGSSPATLTAPASAGTLTFPSQLLSQAGTGAMTLTVQVSEPLASVPSMPLRETNGATLLMLVTASTSETFPVDIE